ncbi:SRPBCC family protein [Actinacidiphila glaucinigra]|uniref:Carbon monoxide dehydrogenase subunit G n=1 Tax=Actinacidiphila glaucinigra TaxID=235986 RepID=A0A238ZLL5_9ACTN|nr:SRPBCC family protein [Actinacidiphila glaucinigra]SNR84346.1 Carbon monoxide dehydrogenase subunit G [Actinacidiphila glaucinigra]
MPSTELEHTFRVAAPPEEVYAHLAEPTHYIGLSPLLVDVRDVHLSGGSVHYTAVERFRFLGLLRHDNVIGVTLVAVPDRLPHSAEISGEVRSPARVRMGYRFAIERDGAGSIVTDTLRLRTPPGLLRFAASQAGAVQRARARVLKARLDRPA